MIGKKFNKKSTRDFASFTVISERSEGKSQTPAQSNVQETTLNHLLPAQSSEQEVGSTYASKWMLNSNTVEMPACVFQKSIL